VKYISTTQAAQKWNLSARIVAILCAASCIVSVLRVNRNWIIPGDAEKPGAARVKSGKYLNKLEVTPIEYQ